MILSKLDSEQWKTVSSHVDTVCLYVSKMEVDNKSLSTLSGDLRNVTLELDNELMGRILVIPDVYYFGIDLDAFKEYIEGLIETFFRGGFTYCILIVDPLMSGVMDEIDHSEKSRTLMYSPIDSKDYSLNTIVERVLSLWSEE